MKHFKLGMMIAAAVLASQSAANAAEDQLKYDDLVHCAAFNDVISEAMKVGDDAAKNKDKADAFSKQSVALMTIAAVGANKTADDVFSDTKKKSGELIGVMASDSTGKDFIAKNYEKCDVMGKAALSIIEDAKNGKVGK